MAADIVVDWESASRELAIKIYKQLWRSRGIKLVLDYFFEVHLFDITNSVDTRGGDLD